MQSLIAKIAAGPKTSKDLTWDEAKRAMRLLIEQQATPVQVGAFLAAMRWKGESVSELAALTSAAREYVAPVSIRTPQPLVDVSLYAGKQDTFHASIGAAIVAAAAGAAVLVHGHDSGSERIGVAGLLSALGIPSDATPSQAGEAVATRGFGYLDLALYHPPLARFLDLRGELGVGTVLHAVARLLNPARAGVQLIGVTHPPYIEKLGEAVRMLGARRALIVRGVEGEPELSITTATRVLDLVDERAFRLMLHPKDIGLAMGHSRDMARPPSAEQEAALVRRVLKNELRGGARDWIVQNAALMLYAAGRAGSISAAVPLAAHAIERGAAAQKLQELTVESAALAPGGAR